MKKFLTVLLVVVMLAAGVNAAFEKVNTYSNNFSDVKDSNWFYENVKTAYELGFMNGKSEGAFDPNGNVTVAEGITMAARLHSIYYGTDIESTTAAASEFRFDFDNLDNVGFNHAVGEVKDGILIAKPDKPNAAGNYDPGIILKNMLLDTRRYNKMKVRMRRDALPNTDPSKARLETMEIFFGTTNDPKFDANKVIFHRPAADAKLEEWYDIEIDFSAHKFWQTELSSIRFDPTNNNGVYYIDYIVLYEDANSANKKWYDKYVDYALANGIIQKAQYDNDEFSRNITRSEICDLFATALPEEYFGAINDIKGIPDVLRDTKNADVYLMLYKAGVLLGSDEKGTFNAASDIRRSEIAAIINRVALPENRVKGTIPADWAQQGNEYDIEFADENGLSNIVIGDAEGEIKNGALVLKPTDRGEQLKPRFDPKITVKNINVDASKYSKLKVRMKIEYIGDINYKTFDFYFATDTDEGFSEKKAAHQDFREFSYIDPAGWYVMELDLGLNPNWNGNITSFRFDPANTNGIFTIDYIRLANGDPLRDASHEILINEGYTATRLMQDEAFERGFYISHNEQKGDHTYGMWQDYCETDEKPLWMVVPIWNTQDLVEHRDTTTDKYTLADDKGINTVKYNPEEKSISLRLNATKIYEGKPHIKDDKSTPDVDEGNYTWWPHLLLEQNRTWCAFDKKRNTAASDRMFLELDARINDFKPTTNPEGTNICDFLIYFYLQTDKAPGQRIWFGMQVFTGANLTMPVGKTGWSPDSGANQYMYGIRMATLYNGMQNSFNPEVGKILMNEWKHIRLDVTPHIDTAIAWANRDNIFGVQVSKEDMYFSGVNIGYEVHGNFDCEVEFKNFNMVAYNK